MTESLRRRVWFNPAPASPLDTPSQPPISARLARKFHQQLPEYQPTRLISLDSIARELGLRTVYLKHEGNRLGLPSFKILGASWGTFRAVACDLGLSPEVELETVKRAVASSQVRLFAVTDGNHGQAVARMGAILSVPVQIYVPAGTHPSPIDLIQSEGASVILSTRDYDGSIREAYEAAQQEPGGLFIQDCAFGSYQEIPKWIVEGYQTMMSELDEQLGDTYANLVLAPVGVGSFAQAVVSHFKQEGRKTSVLTVKPDTAACLWKSLDHGDGGGVYENTTTRTITAGLNFGCVSSIAWPLLRSGVDASLTVSDFEAHAAIVELDGLDIPSGPWGAVPLAALRRLTAEDRTKLGLDQDSVVVLLCTEGRRVYEIPRSVGTDNAVTLTQTLVRINSENPTLGAVSGPGETHVAEYIRAWLEHRNIKNHWIEPQKGRPSIVGIVRGRGEGKSLMLNGHIDTVTVTGYDGDPLSGSVDQGMIYGRGAADMKGGLAAALVALANASRMNLRGDVIFAGVADEESGSIGTEQILQAGWRCWTS